MTQLAASIDEIPKYAQVANDIRGQIENAVLKPGDRLPSYVQMKAIGVGQNTMEKAHALLEREGLIVRDGRRGIFVAERDLEPSAPVGRRSGLIGFDADILLTRNQFYHSSELVGGVRDELARAGYHLVLLDYHAPVGLDEVDGVIISGGDIPVIVPQLSKNVASVTLLSTVPGMASVISDDFEGARQAVRHLIGLGHTRIGCLMEASTQAPRLRVAGYREALEEAGIEPQSAWVRRNTVPFPKAGYQKWGRDVIEKWIAEDATMAGCTALLVHNDLGAIGVMEGLQALGRRVPEDVSVIGFDGIDLCEETMPQLTSVEVPLRQIGATAARILMQQIESVSFAPQSIVLPTELKVRDSTAPPLAV